MPALVFCNRKFRYASDDLIVPAAYCALLHSLFLIVSGISIPQVPDQCGSRKLGVQEYFEICCGIFGAKVMCNILTGFFSLKGTIANDVPRRPVAYVLYVSLALNFVETFMHLNELFMNVLQGPCTQEYSFFNQGHVIALSFFFFFNILHWLAFFIGLGTSKSLKTNAIHDTHKSFTLSSSTPAAILADQGRKGFWYGILSPLFALPKVTPGKTNPKYLFDPSNASLDTLAEATATLFGDADLVVSDIAAGLLLVKRRQEFTSACLKRKGSTVSVTTVSTTVTRSSLEASKKQVFTIPDGEESDSEGDVSEGEESYAGDHHIIMSPVISTKEENFSETFANPVPQDATERLSDAIHFMRYAEAMYGKPLESTLIPCLQQPSLTPDESARRILNKSWMSSILCGLGSRSDHTDIMYISKKNGVFLSPYMIALDHERQAVVITIRGGLSIADIATELQFLPSPVDFKRANGEKGFFFTHGGLWESTQQLFRDIQENKVLEELLLDATSPFKSYRIVLAGHALGGGIACLLGHMIRSSRSYSDKNIQAFCFGAPGFVTSESGRSYLKEFCTSVVLADDMSPATNARNMYLLMQKIRQELISSDNIRKIDLLADCTIKKWFSQGQAQQKTQIPLTHGQQQQVVICNDKDELKMYAPGYLVHFERQQYMATYPPSSKRSYLANEYQPVWKDPASFDEIRVKKNMLLDRLPNRLLHVLNLWAQTSGAHVLAGASMPRAPFMDDKGLKLTLPMVVTRTDSIVDPPSPRVVENKDQETFFEKGMTTASANDSRVPVLSVISAYASADSPAESEYNSLRLSTKDSPDSEFPLASFANLVEDDDSKSVNSVIPVNTSSPDIMSPFPQTSPPSIPLPPSPVALAPRSRASLIQEPKRQSARTMLQRLATRLRDLKAATAALQKETDSKVTRQSSEETETDAKVEAPEKVDVAVAESEKELSNAATVIKNTSVIDLGVSDINLARSSTQVEPPTTSIEDKFATLGHRAPPPVARDSYGQRSDDLSPVNPHEGPR